MGDIVYQAIIRIRFDSLDPDLVRREAEQLCERLDNESFTDVAKLLWVVAEEQPEDDPWPGEEGYKVEKIKEEL